jgi:RNA polymerase sigma-70 factor, ECF subfamily
MRVMVSAAGTVPLLALRLPAVERAEPSPALLDACRRGEREAVAALFDTCKDRVYTLALHLTGDPAEAADVTQDVFLRVMARIGQYRGDARFSTWLHRVVVNVFLDRKKARRRYAPLDESTLARRPSAEPSPEAAVIRAQARGHVAAAVQRLPEKLRVPLVLRYGSGLSYGDIAVTLGLREGTVASRLSRALAQLARELGSGVP